MRAAASNKARQAAALTIADERGDAFRFALERDEDTVYELPLLQDLPARTMSRLAKVGDGDVDVDTILDTLDLLCPGLADVATNRELAGIMEAWSDASAITLGE